MTTRGQKANNQTAHYQREEILLLNLTDYLDGTEEWESSMEDATEKDGMLIRYAPVGKLSVCLAVCLGVGGRVGAGIITAAG